MRCRKSLTSKRCTYHLPSNCFKGICCKYCCIRMKSWMDIGTFGLHEGILYRFRIWQKYTFWFELRICSHRGKPSIFCWTNQSSWENRRGSKLHPPTLVFLWDKCKIWRWDQWLSHWDSHRGRLRNWNGLDSDSLVDCPVDEKGRVGGVRMRKIGEAIVSIFWNAFSLFIKLFNLLALQVKSCRWSFGQFCRLMSWSIANFKLTTL